MKILDCTLRDGGYYTNWDFNKNTVSNYIKSLNQLPIDYIEIGYRSKPMKDYMGEYFYCPLYVMEEIHSVSNKSLVIMFDEKDVRAEDSIPLLEPCHGLIKMVRLAVDPKNILRSIKLAENVKKMGFEVGYNVMYMSKWAELGDFLNNLKELNGLADYFYMVDSYGGVYPEDIKNTYNLVKSKIDAQIGFHGHNNMEMALINTITAIDCGCDIVDATITGMGRGAGNLKTELLLTALNAKGKIDFEFNSLTKVVDEFAILEKEYEWGTNLPYMVSGAHSLPQKDVMEWVSKRYYSFNSIIRALQNQSKGVKDNESLPIFNQEKSKYKKALIVGGGPSVKEHSIAIKKYLLINPDIVIIHASSKNALVFSSLINKQIFCLVGNEGHRMEEVFSGEVPQHANCVLPPYPRKMGTYIPHNLSNIAFELSSNTLTEKFTEAHTSIALQTAIELGIEEVEVVGYDGYSGNSIGFKEQELLAENDNIFSEMISKGVKCSSLTATKYKNLIQESIFSRI